MELAQRPVVARQWPLPLQDVDFNRRLVVSRGGEGLRLAGRDCRIAWDHWRSHAAQRLDRQRKRSHVEQEEVLNLALEHATLDGRAHRDDLIRVHALVGLFAEELFHQRLNARHAGLTAHQHDLVDLAGVNSGVLHALFAGSDRALDDVLDHGFQLGPGQSLDQVLGTAGIRGDEGQIDLVLHGGGELDLGPFRRVTQTLQGHLIAFAPQIETFIFLEFFD